MPINYLYIDENFLLDFDNESNLNSKLKKLLEIFRELSEQNMPAVLSINYWEILLDTKGRALYEILFSDEAIPGLTHEEVRELTHYFDRCQIELHAKCITNISCKDTIIKSNSGIYSIARNRNQKIGECPLFLCQLSKNNSGHGEYSLDNNINGTIDCFILSNTSDIIYYYRHIMQAQSCTGRNFLPSAKKAFPSLHFHPSIAIEDLDVDLKLHFGMIIHHLTFLNDEYEQLGISLNWDLPKLKLAARARGVEFSDESANTKNDARKIRLRIRTFSLPDGDVDFSCSLHTKILPTMGRIYFHNPHAKSAKKLLIGIFHKHLPI